MKSIAITFLVSLTAAASAALAEPMVYRIAQAYCDSQPMLVLSGGTPMLTHGKGWGAIHELNDQAAVTAGFTALSAMVRYPEELPELVARAYGIFRGARPRPVRARRRHR